MKLYSVSVNLWRTVALFSFLNFSAMIQELEVLSKIFVNHNPDTFIPNLKKNRHQLKSNPTHFLNQNLNDSLKLDEGSRIKISSDKIF